MRGITHIVIYVSRYSSILQNRIVIQVQIVWICLS